MAMLSEMDPLCLISIFVHVLSDRSNLVGVAMWCKRWMSCVVFLVAGTRILGRSDFADESEYSTRFRLFTEEGLDMKDSGTKIIATADSPSFWPLAI